MTADSLITKILTRAFTKADVHRHLWLMRTYLERRWFGTGDAGTLEEFYAHAGASERERAVAGALGDEVGRLSKETMYPVFDEAQKKVKTLPFLAVSIPIPADEATVERIGSWIRTNVNENVIIDIAVDPKMVGGCAFAYRGFLYEYALHRTIEKNKEKIRSMLNDYAGKASQ
jgi:hypothetical protein